ncbi:MAG TPA: nuclear transport factor 2 family protein [Pyrinomonadaceae bacterium]|nr:nuclear transport factor 2 family protein [Pyrinomonadaceae bacterium]
MLRKSFFIASLVLTLAATSLAQEIIPIERLKKPAPRPTPAPKSAPAQTGTTQAAAVRGAFDSLVDGIRRTDAEAVMKLYWNSPQLAIFNNNGTVTRGWAQAHSNRVSLYEKTKDVKLDVRDVRVKTLGPSAAIVTCFWDQTQTADGQPEHATGRLTLVYQKIGAEWKIVHTHTSPDSPDPSNLLPSERERETDATPAKPADDATPAKPPVKPEADKAPVKPPAKR